ncbi:MAG: hypothetical protein AB7O79_08290 [Xanthobacteraceae bacterium]|uniref:hypothetical protein n=1 Tax=Pseudorhodoplanes sp. TaxID=1934341 RepID=UPI003D0CB15F
MKAAVIHERGGPGGIKYGTNFPDPVVGRGEVLIKVHSAGINEAFRQMGDRHLFGKVLVKP